MEANLVVLMSKAATLHNKEFLFEFKENQSGQYLCISNGRFGIEVPTSVISVFLKVFKTCSPEKKFVRLRIAGKVYEFRAGENDWGRFRKVSQVWETGSQYIVVPVEASEGLETKIMEMYTDLCNLFPPKEGNNDINDVMVQEIPQHNHPINEDRCKIMSFGDQKFSFTRLESSDRLRITERKDMNVSSIFVPMSALRQFHGYVGHFLEPSNGSSSSAPEQDLAEKTSDSNLE